MFNKSASPRHKSYSPWPCLLAEAEHHLEKCVLRVVEVATVLVLVVTVIEIILYYFLIKPVKHVSPVIKTKEKKVSVLFVAKSRNIDVNFF